MPLLTESSKIAYFLSPNGFIQAQNVPKRALPRTRWESLKQYRYSSPIVSCRGRYLSAFHFLSHRTHMATVCVKGLKAGMSVCICWQLSITWRRVLLRMMTHHNTAWLGERECGTTVCATWSHWLWAVDASLPSDTASSLWSSGLVSRQNGHKPVYQHSDITGYDSF